MRKKIVCFRLGDDIVIGLNNEIQEMQKKYPHVKTKAGVMEAILKDKDPERYKDLIPGKRMKKDKLK